MLIDTTTREKFVTCWLGVYRNDTQILVSINAGDNPPLLYRNGNKTPQNLGSGGLFLGFMETKFQSETIFLKKGDVLVFYFDGVTEAWNRRKEDYGEEALQRIIAGNTRNSAPQIMTAIIGDVKRHTGRAPQNDDLTLGVVKVL